MSQTQLINTALIAELAGVLPTHELANTMERFARELVAKREQLAVAAQAHDCDAVCKVAHAMTGTCGTFGAALLSEKCRQLQDICEENSRNGQTGPICTPDMEARIDDINTCIDDTLAALEKALLQKRA